MNNVTACKNDLTECRKKLEKLQRNFQQLLISNAEILKGMNKPKQEDALVMELRRLGFNKNVVKPVAYKIRKSNYRRKPGNYVKKTGLLKKSKK